MIGYSMLRTFGVYDNPTFGGIIHEHYRGRGYGKKLLKETLKKAKELNFEKVLLKVEEENIKAVNLYKKVGFRIKTIDNNEIWMEMEI